MQLNLKNTPNNKSNEFELLPEGNYCVSVEKVELRYSNSGNEMINLTFKVEDEEFKGKRIWDTLFTTEKTLPRLKTALTSMNFDPTVDFNTEDLIEALPGATCMVDCIHKEETWNGETKTKLKVDWNGYAPWMPEKPAPGTLPKAKDNTEEFEDVDFSDVPF